MTNIYFGLQLAKNKKDLIMTQSNEILPKFTKIILTKKSAENKPDNTELKITPYCYGCDYSKNIDQNCHVISKNLKSNICEKPDGTTCIAIQSKFSMGDVLFEIQKEGFFDPDDYDQNEILKLMINDDNKKER